MLRACSSPHTNPTHNRTVTTPHAASSSSLVHATTTPAAASPVLSTAPTHRHPALTATPGW